MRDIVVLTHKNCVDGFAAAWVVYYYYHLQEDREITYILNFIYVDNLDINAGIEEFKEYCEKIGCYKAYAFDIEFDYQNYRKIMKIFPEIVIIDHHKSGREDILKYLPNMPKNYIHQFNECGCTLAWKLFFKNSNIPIIFEYIRDADLGQFKLENSQIIWEGICGTLTIGDFDKWTKFIINGDIEIGEIEKIGGILCEIRNEKYIKLIETGKIIEMEDLKGFVINASEDIINLGKYINKLKDYNNKYLVDFSLIWYYDMSKSLYNVTLIPNQNQNQNQDRSILFNIAKLFTDNIKSNEMIITFNCEKLFFLH